MNRDTIAAVATPPGRGGIGVVRVSGAELGAIVAAVAGRAPRPRRAVYADFLDDDGSAIDQGICLFFPAPNSFTGEDVLELQGHGGPVVMERLLERVLALGARLARPGEFTERAFLNDRIDLAQAEAVADLIASASRRAARSAMRSLTGEFSERVLALDAEVRDARVHVEAAIDFADEEIDFLEDDQLIARLDRTRQGLNRLLAESSRGQVLRDGLDVVIAGAPNVGKSSLLNRLIAEDRAIVTATPGTTRDAVQADTEIGGVPVRLTDTAGMRDASDDVEKIGVARAREAASRADLVLHVGDDSAPAPATVTAAGAGSVIEVVNKVDLTDGRAGSFDGTLRVSALTGAGLDELKARIAEVAGAAPGEGAYLARRRHLEALHRARAGAEAARERTRSGQGELAAEELRLVHEALGSIVGLTTTDDLLGEIFGAFCIGK